MKIFILVVAVVVVCGVAALLLGLAGGGMGRSTTSLKHEPLPADRLTDDDVAALQLDVTARGYRMSQVDAVLDRLRRELRERDEEIAVLRGEDPEAHPADEPRAVDPEPGQEPATEPHAEEDAARADRAPGDAEPTAADRGTVAGA